MLEANPADHQESWLPGGASRKLQELRIVPELLGSKEVDAVLGKVGGTPLGLPPRSPLGWSGLNTNSIRGYLYTFSALRVISDASGPRPPDRLLHPALSLSTCSRTAQRRVSPDGPRPKPNLALGPGNRHRHPMAASPSAAFLRLRAFIAERMRMSHVYQPLMLLELLGH